MKTKHQKVIKSTQRKVSKRLVILGFIFITFLLPIHGQESAYRLNEVEKIMARHEAETKANETEILRMKLALERETVQRQVLIIVLGIVLFICGALFTGMLYISRKQIRKKNVLLLHQNKTMQAQNHEIKDQQEEILAQADQLVLKNEFLIAQYQRLEELNREKDGLISIVAHDLRTPINQSKGFAELLKSNGLTAEQSMLVNMITKVSDDGLQLISDLLQFNALAHETFEPATIALDQFIQNTIERTFKPLAERKGIHLQIAVEQELMISTHPQYLKRILENLLSNAIKFSWAGSTVMLRVLSSNEAVYISVEDQGPGISEEDQKKMFKKFQRLTARPTSGEPSTGLGLAIVKELVEKLKGELTVKSELEKGTTFVIRFCKSVKEDQAVDELRLPALQSAY